MPSTDTLQDVPERVQIYRDLARMIQGSLSLAVSHGQKMPKGRDGFRHIRREVDALVTKLRVMANEADPAVPDEDSSWSSEG